MLAGGGFSQFILISTYFTTPAKASLSNQDLFFLVKLKPRHQKDLHLDIWKQKVDKS